MARRRVRNEKATNDNRSREVGRMNMRRRSVKEMIGGIRSTHLEEVGGGGVKDSIVQTGHAKRIIRRKIGTRPKWRTHRIRMIKRTNRINKSFPRPGFEERHFSILAKPNWIIVRV